MALAGSLEIELRSDVARLRQDMSKALGIVQSNARAMEDAAAKVRSALGSIGGGLSVAAFGMWIKGAIDAADSMNDLSKSTDIAVGKLSGLKLAAKQSGSDLEGTAKSINKLQLEIGKDSEKFAKIGITAKDGLGAFKQLADVFKEIKDPQLRAAVAAEALGKAWAGAAPLLSEGSKKIQEMVDKGELLSGMTQAAATSADEFNDRLAELETALGGTAMQIASGVLPLMTVLVEDLTTTASGVNDLDGSFNPLNETLRALIILGGNVAFVLRGVGTEIGGVAAQIAALGRGDIKGFLSIGGEMKADAEKGRAAFDAWEKKILSVGTAAKATAADAKSTTDALSASRLAALKGFVDQDKAKKAADALNKELAEQAKLLAELAGLSGSFAADWEGLSKAFRAGKLTLEQLTDAQSKLLAKQPGIKAAAEERMKLLKAEAEAQQEFAKEVADAYVAESKAREQARAAVSAYSKGIDEAADLLKLEKSLISATQEVRDRTIAQYKIELELKKQIEAIDASAGFDEAQREEQRDKARMAAIQARASAELQIEVDVAAKAQGEWKQVSDSFVDNLMRGGKSVAEYLKDLFRTLVLRPILQPVGNLMASAVNSVVGGGGSMLGSGSSLFSTAGSAMSTAYTAGAAASVGVDAFGVGTVGSSGGVLAGMSSAVTTGLSAIGPVGWVALAAIAAYSIFGGSKGGPKDEAGYSPNGLGIAGTDIGGNMQGSQRGDIAAAKQYSDTISGAYKTLADTLGLAKKSLDVGIFYSKDTKGDSLTQLQVTSSAGYNRGTRLGGIENVGRTDEELQAAITEETTRVLLEALKTSDLAQQYKDVLNGLADTASMKDMQAAIDRITAARTQQLSLEEQLFQLTHTDAEKMLRLREQERAAVDPLNAALLEQVYAQQDLKAATEAATAAATQAASERYGLETQLLQLQGNTAALRERELATLDESNRAIQQQIYDLTDAKNAQAEVQQASGQIFANVGDIALAAATAAVTAASQWDQTAKSIADAMAKLRGDITLTSAQSYAQAYAQFTTATAQARAGDKTAADSLPGLALRVNELQRARAGSAFEANAGTAGLMASLDSTLRKIPSYDVGTPSVPRTGLAIVHQGEEITPAGQQGTVEANRQAEMRAVVGNLAEMRKFLQELVEKGVFVLPSPTGETITTVAA